MDCGAPYWPASVIISLSKMIIRGLEFLHSHKIIHRDLKVLSVMLPTFANTLPKSHNVFVLLNEREEIKTLAIGDFDTAKLVTAKAQAKTILGTTGWMASSIIPLSSLFSPFFSLISSVFST